MLIFQTLYMVRKCGKFTYQNVYETSKEENREGHAVQNQLQRKLHKVLLDKVKAGSKRDRFI